MRTKDETLIKEQEVRLDDAVYLYRLTVSISEVVASYKLPLYSVFVSMTDSQGKRTEAVCADAFADIGKALVFFDKIVRTAVTPIDLAYVYEDELR